MPDRSSWDTKISAFSAVIALFALGISWNTANRQTYRDKIDARIANCATVANVYASQSWAYRIGHREPDPDLETYSHKAMAIGRAAQLCRNRNGTIDGLRQCIATRVDRPAEHKVIERGTDGQEYDNLVC